MSTQTEHLHLDLREASDIFNPLSTNANFESLDNIIYEIQTKGGVPTYTTTAAANLLKLSQNPTPNVTVFKFVAAGDANTWSYQETVNNIVALDGKQKTVKGGEMYIAWVNSANAMVVIAWPDVVNAQTFDGKGPAEWASKAQLDAVNQTAANATTTAQAAAAVANNALEVAQAAGFKPTVLWENPSPRAEFGAQTVSFTKTLPENYNYVIIEYAYDTNSTSRFADFVKAHSLTLAGNVFDTASSMQWYSSFILAYFRTAKTLRADSITFDDCQGGNLNSLNKRNSNLVPQRVLYI